MSGGRWRLLSAGRCGARRKGGWNCGAGSVPYVTCVRHRFRLLIKTRERGGAAPRRATAVGGRRKGYIDHDGASTDAEGIKRAAG